MSLIRIGLSLALIALSACQSVVPIHMATNGQVLLRGRVVFSRLSTKATAADVFANATVSLHEMTGEIKAAGVTDATGAFTLYRSTDDFTPMAGTYYRLDVFKRLTAADDSTNTFSLRTIVQRTTDWTSITGPTVTITPTTTAMAMLLDTAGTLQASDLIEMVDSAGTVTPFGSYTALDIANRANDVVTKLTGNLDGGI